MHVGMTQLFVITSIHWKSSILPLSK